MQRTPLKWVGSKARIMDRLSLFLKPASRLVEPFGGSGAVMVNTNYSRYLIGDSNPDLINFHNDVRDNTDELIAIGRDLFDNNNGKLLFYKLRDEFNRNRTPSVYRSALFLYLNRHCYNGVCRYNKSEGGFNVPYGYFQQPYFPEKEIRIFASHALRAEFKCQYWLDTLMEVKHGDIVYIDPPYIPISATSSFTDYTKEGFNLKDQKQLAEALIDLGSYGIPIVASNSGALLALDLYQKFNITNIFAPRSVGGASVAKEIVATLN